jgi:hypothetical protein
MPILSTINDMWLKHKPHIGDYIDQLLSAMIDAQIHNIVTSIGALLGLVIYLFMG